MELVQRSLHHNVTLDDTKYINLKLTITVGDFSINILLFITDLILISTGTVVNLCNSQPQNIDRYNALKHHILVQCIV